MFTLTATVALAGGLVNLYSPALATPAGPLYVGGWLDVGQTEDRIYALSAGRFQERLRRPGWLINDPSLVPAPDGSGWRLYYTGLSAADLADKNGRNVLGVASSPDGAAWTDDGVLVARWNGLDLGGVWSPGALVVNGEVWVYAHSNAPLYRNYRIRLAADGRTVLAIDRLTLPVIPNDVPVACAANLDVAPKAGAPGYWMVANSPNGRYIVLLESEDALVWRLVQTLNANADTQTWTPHLASVVADGFDVIFGWTERPGEWRTKSLHRWTWRR